MVPVIGLEPIRSVNPRDFKSLASAYSAIPAHRFNFSTKRMLLSRLLIVVATFFLRRHADFACLFLRRLDFCADFGREPCTEIVRCVVKCKSGLNCDFVAVVLFVFEAEKFDAEVLSAKLSKPTRKESNLCVLKCKVACVF